MSATGNVHAGVQQLLRRATGMDLSEPTVQRAVQRRMQTLALADSADYLARLRGPELEALVELVVVPESWMFRDPEAFALAASFVRARLASAPARMLRILSIPCAGGEEPYSIAMALADAGVAPQAFRIDGVDLSAHCITRAQRGRYTRNAFRGGDLSFRERHFTAHGNEYQISDALRERVRFNQGNLFELDPLALGGRYDLVFCRNLLIYFDEPTIATAIAKLDALLADEGLLFAGYAEVPAFVARGFSSVRAQGAFALERADAAPPAPHPPRAARKLSPVRASLPAPTRAASTLRPAPALPLAPAPAPSTDVSAQLQAARALADQGELAAAGAAAQAILTSNPDAADAYFILGMVSECEGAHARADAHWRRCIYLQPDHYDALCHLALLCEHAGEPAQADTLRQRAARVFQRRPS